MRAAVFLDRDGTVCVEENYLGDPARVSLLPGAATGISEFNAAGIPVIIVSNQSGVARGFFGEDEVAAVNARLEALLLEDGARIDGFYHCPHHPDYGAEQYRIDCNCRKPSPGMLQAAAADHGLDLQASYIIGDKDSDVHAGWNVGCAGSVLVASGYGAECLKAFPAGSRQPDYIASDFLDASRWVLERIRS